ncbi:hypothetical protein Ancab_039657 [Ancistrocladus abbreviatus]
MEEHECTAEHCAGCGMNAGCKKCGSYLHKHCSQWPLELRHPFHPNGRLMAGISCPGSDTYLCKLCNHIIEEGMSVYVCHGKRSDGCNHVQVLILHMDCGLLRPSLEDLHPYHKHPLVFAKANPYRLRCAACGEKSDNMHEEDVDFYHCLECGDRFHKKCLDMPAQAKHEDLHPYHDLTLHWGPIPEDFEEGKDYYCDVCKEKRDVHLFSHVCKECDFVCHIRCDVASKIQVLQKAEDEEAERECKRLIKVGEEELNEIEEEIKSYLEKIHAALSKKYGCEKTLKDLHKRIDEIEERRRN